MIMERNRLLAEQMTTNIKSINEDLPHFPGLPHFQTMLYSSTEKEPVSATDRTDVREIQVAETVIIQPVAHPSQFLELTQQLHATAEEMYDYWQTLSKIRSTLVNLRLYHKVSMFYDEIGYSDQHYV